MINKFIGTIFIAFALIFATNIKAQSTWGDYTLYSMKSANNAYLIDMSGNTYKTWTFSNAQTEYSSYLMPGGILWRTVGASNSFQGGASHGRIQKVAYDGTILWDYTHNSSTYCLHHDICPMPNGNVLLISYESKTAAEASAAGCSQSMVIWSEKIIEVKPTGTNSGEIVWEWHLWDHLVQNVSASKNNYQTSIVEHPELLNINYSTTKDWVHMNGIDYNPILDQIVVSSHNLNELWVIDHSTTTAEAASHSGGLAGKGGDFLYRWGNPAAYEASGTKIFNVVHDAHWIKEGCPNAGRLVAFNNRGVSTQKSSIDQVAPPINGYNYDITLGSAYTPSTYTERHACNGVTQSMGNSQQLPNGGMLVCITGSNYLYEIDETGTSVWTKQLSSGTGGGPGGGGGGGSAKAFRYNSCYINNEAPAIPTITENSGVLSSTAATTYQWYLNGVQISGATAQTYTPTVSGGYLVRTTDENGCVYQYSKTYVYNNGLDPTIYTITASAGENGSISPSGTVNIIEGNSQLFTFTPNANYKIATVSVDNVDVTSSISNNSYTFSNVTANHTINATFVETSINENFTSNLDIFPNPTKDVINVVCPYTIRAIEIYDILGKNVLSSNCNSNNVSLNISKLTSGIFYIKITTQNETITRKIIKK